MYGWGNVNFQDARHPLEARRLGKLPVEGIYPAFELFPVQQLPPTMPKVKE
jgi:hypothetical protein